MISTCYSFGLSERSWFLVIRYKVRLVTNYRAHVENPELILSTIALHAVFVLFAKFMKKAIDNSTMGMLQVILTEILASFIFVACIFEKGLWYQNVNENYFHVATAAQFIYFVTFLPGKSNPLGLIQQHGPGVQVCSFFFVRVLSPKLWGNININHQFQNQQFIIQ